MFASVRVIVCAKPCSTSSNRSLRNYRARRHVPTRRFAVHRNNVVVGFVNALRSRFPVVEKIVGEEFFAAMARVFVSSDRRLAAARDLWRRFAAFIATFAPP